MSDTGETFESVFGSMWRERAAIDAAVGRPGAGEEMHRRELHAAIGIDSASTESSHVRQVKRFMMLETGTRNMKDAYAAAGELWSARPDLKFACCWLTTHTPLPEPEVEVEESIPAPPAPLEAPAEPEALPYIVRPNPLPAESGWRGGTSDERAPWNRGHTPRTGPGGEPWPTEF